MHLLSDLLRAEVVDVDGTSLGRVHDVRLVQDGPFLEGFGASLRVDALIVGGSGFAARLGFDRHDVRGPLPLKWLSSAMQRRTRSVSWSDVEPWDGGTVRLTRAASRATIGSSG